MSKEIIYNEKIYNQIIKKIFNLLVKDKIVDVRITMAKFLSKILKQNKINYLLNNKNFIHYCKILSNDTKLSVSQYFNNLKININKEEENLEISLDENFHLLKTNNFEWLQKEFSVNIDEIILGINFDLIINENEVNTIPENNLLIFQSTLMDNLILDLDEDNSLESETLLMEDQEKY